MDRREKSGVTRLRELRVRRAWTQQDVALRLGRLALLVDSVHVGVNADMVSKWERGEKCPSAMYVRLLSGLFEVSPAEFALSESDGTPDASASARVAYTDVLDMLDLPDGTPAVGDLLFPKMLEIGRRELLHRRQMLRAMGIAPAAVGLDALSLASPISPVASSAAAGGPHLDRLRAATRELEVLYHSADPRRLTTPIEALALAIEDALPEVRDRARRRLGLRLLSRANLLAGRLALFDLRRPLEARARLDLAREAAQEAGDGLLASVIFGHMAFLPGMKKNYSSSASYLSAARGATSSQPGPVKAWLCAVDGELNTWARCFDLARKAHDRARTLMSHQDAVPEWFDFFDEARLAGFEGYARRASGDLQGARTALTAAMAAAAGMSPKQRAVLTIDSADVCIAQGDLDEGCRQAGRAADELSRVHYATAVERLLALQRAVPSQRHPAVRRLSEQVAELTEARP
jgi:transcriptional regulator with XRE-family HTH domain